MTTVVAAALIEHGRVLAARRVRPADVAGGWELPGGKVDPGETAAEAVVREVAEELGCDVEAAGPLGGRSPIKPGYELVVELVRLVRGSRCRTSTTPSAGSGRRTSTTSTGCRRTGRSSAELRALLLDGEPLPGGNVGGAVRIGAPYAGRPGDGRCRARPARPPGRGRARRGARGARLPTSAGARCWPSCPAGCRTSTTSCCPRRRCSDAMRWLRALPRRGGRTSAIRGPGATARPAAR